MKLAEAHGDERYEARLTSTESFEQHLTKNAHLVFKGKIDDFLEEI